ncbi:MAG: PspC domain-containing protein [Bacteroidetes bacterium]|jgi:phage shock protein PspC (stress-responsive transcriptional regulator)|nr:PspC domain-containing protein [Bacteroidota bacterium]
MYLYKGRLRQFIFFLQLWGFKVCQRIGDSWGIRPRVVRLSFVYLTFITFGFGFALYLFIAFWLKISDLIYTRRDSVFDL